jgi:hypothetical protein
MRIDLEQIEGLRGKPFSTPEWGYASAAYSDRRRPEFILEAGA